MDLGRTTLAFSSVFCPEWDLRDEGGEGLRKASCSSSLDPQVSPQFWWQLLFLKALADNFCFVFGVLKC